MQQCSLTTCNTILQNSIVEYVGWEHAECRVHAVLHLQQQGTHTQNNQSLK